jgi:hypothetical protein
LFFLFLLAGMTAGNMAGYLLCKLAVTSGNSLKNCDCVSWLSLSNTIAAKDGEIQAPSFKSVSTDSMPVQFPTISPLFNYFSTGYHVAHHLSLPDRQVADVFRPPAA